MKKNITESDEHLALQEKSCKENHFFLFILSGVAVGALHFGLSQFTTVIPPSNTSLEFTMIAFALGFLLAFFMFRVQEIYSKILVGMLSGVVFGFVFGPIVTENLSFVGEIFIRSLKMIVVPLVFASLVLGVISLGDIKKIGRIGSKTVIYFMVTTVLAITIGIFLANFFRPGSYISQENKEKYQQQYKSEMEKKVKDKEKSQEEKSLKKLLINIIPENPLRSFASGDMLAIIFFAILFGLSLTKVNKEKKYAMEKILETLHDAMITMVMWIMSFAPIGVFFLIADTIAKSGVEVLRAMFIYALVVIAGFALHVFFIFGFVVRVFGKMSLWEFLQKTREVWLLAFSTSSSSATLPVTMRCSEENLNVSKEISGFVLPIGSTINMDGTSLYLGISAIFLAQMCGIPLRLEQQIIILITATLCSVGSPGIPGGSLVFLIILLETINIPSAGIALILGIDRILDMFRTVVNVLGDMTAAIFIDSLEKKEVQS